MEHTQPTTSVPARDPGLQRARPKPAAYYDVFVDDFIALAQGSHSRLRKCRRVLFHALDSIFRPPDEFDSAYRQHPLSQKKLKKGDCCWATKREILGWIIDTVAMTLSLPQKRIDKLRATLDSIPVTQKRISVQRWQQVIGELRSVAIALPGARGLFSHLQRALRDKEHGARIKLSAKVHDELNDFRWLQEEVCKRPTRLQEIVPLEPSAYGPHDASGIGAGGVVFPAQNVTPRILEDGTEPDGTQPVLWRVLFPDVIRQHLVSDNNPKGTITNSDLELVGGLLHRECAVQCFNLTERTFHSETDNTPTLFWERKGSTSTASIPPTILRAGALHQRYHRYVARNDFRSGDTNTLADTASRFTGTDTKLLALFDNKFPQTKPWRLWTPSPALLSTVISILLERKHDSASLFNEPRPPTRTGSSGTRSAESSLWTPFSQRSKAPSQSSKSSRFDTVAEPSLRTANQFDPEQLRMPYARLAKRSQVWGPRTHDSMGPERRISASNDSSSCTRSGTLPLTG